MDFQSSLSTDTVTAAYPQPPLAVTPDTTVRDVLLLLKMQRRNSVLVCEHEALIGIFTERDALRLMVSGAPLSGSIRDVMTSQAATVSAQATVGEAIRIMSEGGYRRLPIVDDQRVPTGVSGVRGIVRYIVEHIPESVYNLPPDSKGGPSEREGP